MLWDTAGQERFRTIVASYYRDTQAVAVVYDITNSASFANITEWLGEISRYAPEGTPVILLGNKSDLGQRAVPYSTAKDFADAHKCQITEVSAKSGAGLEEVFTELAADLVRQALANA
eukprot:TRINITY_DN5436_c0_g1_i3.p2 TRINITY_DN5436_c0_g1~~TRINITY_DN5436_c0_g1_i3.p2  ORF type:complete len:118 (+),score=21.74 TRINITY_DN5436_c0_g1_i3:225-578(+)